ncbi:prepilin-type N-terminal cleavage/methylation domain-containing protein [bacterium]|nr:prepilin-type N-terminal cleavage/methylation domain-containing protein [bacterium]
MVQIRKTLCGLLKPRRSLRQRRGGVTLLEILVAVAILAFSISAIMQIFPMGFSASAKASYTAIAYELAGQKMEEIRATNIFGGDADPSLAANAPDTYKFFGHRTHPLTAIKGAGQTEETVNEFVDFESSDGANVESRYFYKVELLPQVDIGQKSGNFIYSFGTSDSGAPGDAYGFCDAYRVKVTVRGPVRKKEYAQDDNWVYYKKGAVEATLATIISNKEFGVAYLALDLVCRVVDSAGKEWMWNDDSATDSRSIYVTGPNNKRFYPESFAVLRPEFLTKNERWDTGPAITFPCNAASAPASVDAYYASRGDLSHRYAFRQGTENVTDHTINFQTIRNRNLMGSISGFQGYNYSHAGSRRFVNNSSWNDLQWNTANDTRHEINAVNPATKNTSCAHASSTTPAFVPGGLNYMGQDNIMLICARNGHYYAESNKLIFMAPPNTNGQIVNQYGIAHATHNKTNYWRFDLLNQVYGRDSDCKVRESWYGAKPLVDSEWGDPTTTEYSEQGDFNLKSYSADSVDRTTNIIVGQDSYTSVTAGNLVDNGDGTATLRSNQYQRVYGYPKAKCNSNGILENGTVVRFLMTMYTK